MEKKTPWSSLSIHFQLPNEEMPQAIIIPSLVIINGLMSSSLFLKIMSNPVYGIKYEGSEIMSNNLCLILCLDLVVFI